MIDDATVAKVGGGSILTLVIGWFVRSFLLRWSRDSVDKAENKERIDIIALQRIRIKELETALEIVYKERNDAVSELGSLRTEVRLLRERVEELNNLVSTIKAPTMQVVIEPKADDNG